VKAIAHFVTGIALATFFPEVVERAADGSILPVLGGVAGILPDTLDFRFVRYLVPHDLEIDPGPEPDARRIAQQVADAMHRAYEDGEPRRVMLHTIRLGPDQWRQYVIRFDPERGEVAVRIGPVVDTGQTPRPHHLSPIGGDREGGTPCPGGSDADAVPALRPASEPSPHHLSPEGGDREGEVRVPVGVPIVHTYDREIAVDIFSGPSFTFQRQDDVLHVHFLDWHRRWSHSLTLAMALGLFAAGLAALAEALSRGTTTAAPLWIGLVTALGLAGHVLEDQLGCMGSNLFFPFTRARTPGLGLVRSGDAVPNFLTVWTAVMLTLFNLDRFAAQPRLRPLWFLGLAVVLPVVVLGGIYQRGRQEGGEGEEVLGQEETVSPLELNDLG